MLCFTYSNCFISVRIVKTRNIEIEVQEMNDVEYSTKVVVEVFNNDDHDLDGRHERCNYSMIGLKPILIILCLLFYESFIFVCYIIIPVHRKEMSISDVRRLHINIPKTLFFLYYLQQVMSRAFALKEK